MLAHAEIAAFYIGRSRARDINLELSAGRAALAEEIAQLNLLISQVERADTMPD